MKSAITRFEAKVQRDPAGCWLWQSAMGTNGYPQFWLAGRSRWAHQVAYELFVGPIPVGMCVCHRCDVPRCVNPAHLFLGTQADNTADKMQKGRQARGAQHGMTKLSDADKAAIAASGEPTARLAARYGVDRTRIQQLRRGAR